MKIHDAGPSLFIAQRREVIVEMVFLCVKNDNMFSG